MYEEWKEEGRDGGRGAGGMRWEGCMGMRCDCSWNNVAEASKGKAHIWFDIIIFLTIQRFYINDQWSQVKLFRK